MSFETDKANVLNALKSGQRIAVEVELSPEMVDWLLERNSPRNRNPSKFRISNLKAQMERHGFVPCSEFKFLDGFLVDGQHRLFALQKLYSEIGAHEPFQKQRIVVGISDTEAYLIDTQQPRNIRQSLKIYTGNDYSSELVSAVKFKIQLRKIKGQAVTMDAVYQEMQKQEWIDFQRVVSPEYTLANSDRAKKLSSPIYVALMEFWERVSQKQWSEFWDEFRCEKAPSKMVIRLRSLIEGGIGSIDRKFRVENSDSNRTTMYKLCVTLLKAYLNNAERCALKPSDWDD